MQQKSNRSKGKSPGETIDDGVLAYGVIVGRFVFEEEGYTVFVLSDLPHIGPSDVLMIYQISKEDYLKLLAKSCKHRIPNPPVSSITTDACRKRFLCGESAYCKRYYCTLEDVDLSLAERNPVPNPPDRSRANVMRFCPNCGTKNNGGRYCTQCGTKLERAASTGAVQDTSTKRGASAMSKRFLKSGMTSGDITYYIYEDTDGSVFAETLSCRHCHLAESVSAFYRLSLPEVERKIYNAEMSGAR